MVGRLAQARRGRSGHSHLAGRRLDRLAAILGAARPVAGAGTARRRHPPGRLLRRYRIDAAPGRVRLRARRRSRGRRGDSHRSGQAASPCCRIFAGGTPINAIHRLVPTGDPLAGAQRGRHHAGRPDGPRARHRGRPVERHRPGAPASHSSWTGDGRRWSRPVPPRHSPGSAAGIRRRSQAGLGIRVAEPHVGRAPGRGREPNIDRPAAPGRAQRLGRTTAARSDDRDLRHRRRHRRPVQRPRPIGQAAMGTSGRRDLSHGLVVWFTGLSGAGKSTIATALQAELTRRGRHSELLDGDEVRTHLSKGLGFSKEDRDTNIRRIGYVARLIARSGGVAITAAISPHREVRDELRGQTPGFVEVFVRAPLDTLVERDTKGLYRKAIAGEIANFTGVSDPYEEPLHPEVVCDTSTETVAESVAKVVATLERLGHLERVVTQRLPSGEELSELRAEARRLPQLQVGQRELSDVFMLGAGALSPLDRFLGREDYESVVAQGRLAGGAPFTIPIVLRTDDVPAADRVGLFIGDKPVGILEIAEAFEADPGREALEVYGTDDEAHPGVRLLKDSGRWAVGGAVIALARPTSGVPDYDLTPAQVREGKAQRGGRTIVGLQTRNPVHPAHDNLL